MTCTTGVFLANKVKFGIIPSTESDKNICLNNTKTAKCSAALNQVGIEKYVNESCNGKAKCALDVANQIKAKYMSGGDTACRNGSDFFIQMPCVVPEEETKDRQVYGLFIGCLGVFIALFYTLYIDYLRSIFKLAYVEWDVKTITAGDYSVELTITQKMWDNFIKTKYDPDSGKSRLS
jgi:hypothetical protein